MLPRLVEKFATVIPESQTQPFPVAHRIPELQHINRAGIFIDGIDDPILRAPADTEQVRPIRRASESKIAPGQRSLEDIGAQDAIQALNLLDGEIFAIASEIF